MTYEWSACNANSKISFASSSLFTHFLSFPSQRLPTIYCPKKFTVRSLSLNKSRTSWQTRSDPSRSSSESLARSSASISRCSLSPWYAPCIPYTTLWICNRSFLLWSDGPTRLRRVPVSCRQAMMLAASPTADIGSILQLNAFAGWFVEDAKANLATSHHLVSKCISKVQPCAKQQVAGSR